MKLRAPLALLSLVAGLSCSKGTPAPQGANGFQLLVSDCDPLVPSKCGFPFPSNVWRVQDAATKQYKIHFGNTTLPTLKGSAPTDPGLWENRDGFSTGQAMLAQLPGATAAGFADENHLADSATAASPTVIINADTGAFVPHIAELDQWTSEVSQQSLMMRPVERLADGQRYIVAIRHVKDSAGAAVAPSPAFLALREKSDSADVSVALRRDLYEDIFTKLAAAGIPRADLQLAWDFTTATAANTRTDLLTMRDLALAAVGTAGPSYVINSVEVSPNSHIALRLHGTMTVPFFLTNAGPHGTMVRDANGLPKQNGTQTFQFLVHVPKSCTTGKSCAVVQNGHGLLGSLTEGEDGYLATFCDDFHYVGIAVDWWGFAAADLGQVLNSVIDDLGAFPILVEHQEQGMVNNLLAMRMMKGVFQTEPKLQAADGSGPIYDNTKLFYRGDSQGGIFGATYMSISTDVTRGLLGEPGMPYNLLLDRSVDFQSYRGLLNNALPDARDAEMYLDLIQQFWDRVEPVGYSPMLTPGDTASNTPAHRVLMHAAIGDHQVTTLGAHMLAREIGAVNLKPLNRDIFALDSIDGTVSTGSALVEFSYGLAPVPTMNLPPDCAISKVACASATQYDDDPHDTVRSEPDAMKMADTFFRTGNIAATCDGVCDPE
jgi:hypothetical protein